MGLLIIYIKVVSTRSLTSKGIMYIKARNMVRPFNVKLTAIQSIENQSAASGLMNHMQLVHLRSDGTSSESIVFGWTYFGITASVGALA